MLAGKDITRSTHVGCELIDFVETTIDHASHEVWIAKVADDEVVSFGFAEPRKFKIGTADPEPFPLKATLPVIDFDTADLRDLKREPMLPQFG
jgi:hypothetical protein